MEDFNNLFDDFMGESNKKKPKDDIMSELFKKLSGFNSLSEDEITEQLKTIVDFNKSLGEPNKVETYEENGVYYQKKTWNTQHGQVIKTSISDIPFTENKTRKPKIPLEIQLQKAVDEENYELAAKLRDRITKREAKKNKV